MQGREQEVTLADLHHIAEEEQKAWFDEADSRQVSALRPSACITAYVSWSRLALCTDDVHIGQERQSLYFHRRTQVR